MKNGNKMYCARIFVYVSAFVCPASTYYLLDSTVRIEELVHLAKAMGYHSLALTDYNVLYGLPGF